MCRGVQQLPYQECHPPMSGTKSSVMLRSQCHQLCPDKYVSFHKCESSSNIRAARPASYNLVADRCFAATIYVSAISSTVSPVGPSHSLLDSSWHDVHFWACYSQCRRHLCQHAQHRIMKEDQSLESRIYRLLVLICSGYVS